MSWLAAVVLPCFFKRHEDNDHQMAIGITLNLKKLGSAINRTRKDLGISLSELKKQTGMAASHVLRIESGEFNYNIETYVKLCAALGVHAGFLLELSIDYETTIYADAVKKESVSEQLKTFKDSPEKQVRIGYRLLVNKAILCVIVLLRSSNPVKSLPFLQTNHQPLDKAIAAFAESLHRTDSYPSDRLDTLNELQKAPAATLFRLGVLNVDILNEFCLLTEQQLYDLAKPEGWDVKTAAKFDLPPGF